MIKKGSRVKYTGETNGAYENGKVYEVLGYDEELDAYGVMSDLGEAYVVAEEFLEEVEADYICDDVPKGIPDDILAVGLLQTVIGISAPDLRG